MPFVLNEVFKSFCMVQHVTGPTHRLGGTLDLIATFADCTISNVTVDPAGIVSDHGLVSCSVPARRVTGTMRNRTVRSWRAVDRAEFMDAIRDGPLGVVPPAGSATELFEIYDTTLRRLADQFAPAHAVRSRRRPLAPWFDAECRSVRRECRRLERKYRRTNDIDDRAAWTAATRKKHIDFRAKQNCYWTDRINSERQTPSKLWRSMAKVLRRCKEHTDLQVRPVHTAEAFRSHFDNKVADIRSTTEHYTTSEMKSTTTAVLSSFRVCTAENVRRIVMQSPTKSCDLDPIPTFMLKESIDALLPFLTAMCNASIAEGHLPSSQKHAIVTPLLKKPSLDQSELKNYRPVSNLTFISKIVEKLVSEQLVSYLQSNNLMPCLQSAYRRHHSTETALLRVMSDLLNAADNRRVSLLGLLDLSAAFDCVDHGILLQRFQTSFGITNTALLWIRSFLTERTQSISYDGRQSSICHLFCGVPQGSVLGGLFFILYTAELFDVVAECGLTAHTYADDTQVYFSVPAADAGAAVQQFTECVKRIEAWMGGNRLKLNADKTQVIWIGSRQQLSKVNIRDILLPSAKIAFSEVVCNLGVRIDSRLKMDAHVAAVSRSCFFQLRQLKTVRNSLSTDAANMLVNAFVSSRLDYCNSLLAGISDSLLSKLQSVQNAAARLITRTRKFDHITPILRNLHWLPVRQRIDFKVATLMYKCRQGLAPPYLTVDCVRVSQLPGRRHLRSADTGTLSAPRFSSNYGRRSFGVYGSTVWNSLPVELRTTDVSVLTFRRKLKTHLFNI